MMQANSQIDQQAASPPTSTTNPNPQFAPLGHVVIDSVWWWLRKMPADQCDPDQPTVSDLHEHLIIVSDELSPAEQVGAIALEVGKAWAHHAAYQFEHVPSIPYLEQPWQGGAA